jgi:hypothetical protein
MTACVAFCKGTDRSTPSPCALLLLVQYNFNSFPYGVERQSIAIKAYFIMRCSIHITFLYSLVLGTHISDTLQSTGFDAPQGEDPAVKKFREYLRINSAYPNPDYGTCNAYSICL